MSRGARLKRIFAMRCDEAAELLSQGNDEPLALIDQLALRSHLLLCRPCRRFRQQLKFLHTAMHWVAARAEGSSATLSGDVRVRILNALRREVAD